MYIKIKCWRKQNILTYCFRQHLYFLRGIGKVKSKSSLPIKHTVNQKSNKLTNTVAMQLEDDGHLLQMVVVIGFPDLDENIAENYCTLNLSLSSRQLEVIECQ